MASYYGQFEPAWPGRSAIKPSERGAWLQARKRSSPAMQLGNSLHCQQCIDAESYAVKVTDEAIAHAIRESHRN